VKFLESSNVRRFRSIGLVGIFLLMSCEKSGLAPMVSRETLLVPLQVISNGQILPDPTRRSIHYVVRKGDTLHGIAWRHATQYEDLVEWNKVDTPDLIVIGSVLRLSSSIDQSESITKVKAKANGQIIINPNKGLKWGWPSQHRRFARSQLGGGIGLSFKGVLGETVKAAASGTVVYSGNGLRGYGELLIIQHAGNFLSAYGHNQKLFVSEGDFVTLGEKIATMGKTESKEVNLYFEIRQKGKPVDAFNHLPEK
jgi:lipoprotein YgeR